MIHPLALVVPIVVSVSIAGSIEDGTLKTYLSYPIKRSELFGIKVLTAILVVSTATIIGGVIAFAVFIPPSVSISVLFLLIEAVVCYIVLLVAFGVMASIIFKRVSVAAVGGVGFWYIIQLLLTTGSLQLEFFQILNPLGMTASSIMGYENAIPLNTLPIFLLGSLGLSIVLFIISYWSYNKMDL